MNDKLSILIFSCDLYSDLWDNFFDCFDKFWPNNNYQIYLVNNFKSYDKPGVKVLNAGSGDWSTRARYAFNNIPSKYVLTFLEDYYLCDYVDNDEIDLVLNYIISKNISYYQVDKIDKEDHANWNNYDEKSYLFDIPKTRNYWVDTSVSIWDKNFFLELLGTEDYSAWKFELDRNIETKNPKKYADKICLFDNRSLITICMMVIGGKYYPDSYKFLEKKYKKLKLGNREIMSLKEVWRFKIIKFFSKINFGRKFFKFIARKLGVVFPSDTYLVNKP